MRHLIRKTYMISLALPISLFMVGCEPRGVEVAKHNVGTTKHHTVTKKPIKHTLDQHANHKGTKKNPHLSRSTQLRPHHTPTLSKVVKEIPKTIDEIPIVGNISDALPPVNEIPMVNTIADYLGKGSRTKRRRIAAKISTDTRSTHSSSKKDARRDPFDYSQHFSGGLSYEHPATLNNITFKKNPDGDSVVELRCDKVAPYSIDYDARAKEIVVTLKEYQIKTDSIKLSPSKKTIIKEAKIIPSQRIVTLYMKLRQDAKVNVIVSYSPTKISIYITPMYRLYLGV